MVRCRSIDATSIDCCCILKIALIRRIGCHRFFLLVPWFCVMSAFPHIRSYRPSHFSIWAAFGICFGSIALALRFWAAISGSTLVVDAKSDPKDRLIILGRQHSTLAEAVGFGRASTGPATELSVETRASVEVTNSEWAEQISEPGFWSTIKRQKATGTGGWGTASGLAKDAPGSIPAISPQRSSPAFSNPYQVGENERRGNSRGTYRTMCVRLCDGFYWPISFSTTQDNFDKDAQTCESSCGGPNNARLFSYPNPGGSTEDLEDTSGTAYKKLPKAFAFRVSADPSCKCRAHPWEDAALDQHKLYALESGASKKSAATMAEINALRKKIAQYVPQVTPPNKPTAISKHSQRIVDSARVTSTSINIITTDPERRMSRVPIFTASKIPVGAFGQPQSRPSVPISGIDERFRAKEANSKVSQNPTIVRLHRGSRTPVEVQVEYGARAIRGADVSDRLDSQIAIIRR
jgi:hypothetical protein